MPCIRSPPTQKFDLLLAAPQNPDCRSAIVFTRTKAGADRVAHCLRLQNHPVAVLHADRSQSQRAAALANFRSGQQGILVATDIAARGIDVAEDTTACHQLRRPRRIRRTTCHH